MELLSPAKNLETGILAINSGADAVYIGASDFGARKAAANSVDDIEKLCRHAHLYGAKVYVTLNTILYDNEIEPARKLISKLYNIGVDALIVQDMGILKMDIPPIELHASTQTHNYDMERIKFMDQLGFKRIVLARESSLEHIRSVRQSIRAEIECFVHGALCVSFSGQCYMSAQLGGRSANRGECAQACRMKYSLLNADKKVLIDESYLLSLRDFGAFNKIGQMMDAGVDSLKIEGRLKDQSYVANVTAYYRRIIDSISEGKARNSSGICLYDYEPNIHKVFNRGFTEYFLMPAPGKMANFASPKSMGEEIGKLTSRKGNTISIQSSESISNGDGLCYLQNGSLFGFRIEKSLGNNSFTAITEPSLKPGTVLYRNLDTIFQKKIEHTKTTRKIRIDAVLTMSAHQLEIKITDEDLITSSATIEVTDMAQNQEKALSNLKAAMMKCGDKFLMNSLETQGSEVPFVPNSVANEFRRNALDAHEKKRIAHFAPKGHPTPSASVKYPEAEGNYRLNVANQLARQFYEEHGCHITEPAFELLGNTKGKEVMTTKYCIRREMGYCLKNGTKKAPEDWNSKRYILHGAYQDFDLVFNCKDCKMQIFARK
ncbi:MAG: U32 family peptidase [Bacteroidales bacterium]|nr:U32 family peptidase [Bacteroidales bacterium]